MKMGVDIGYGFTKAVNEKGRKAVFPSLVAAVPKDALGGVIPILNKYRVKYETCGQKGEFLIGEAAKASFSVLQTFSREKPAGIHDALLFAAIALLEDSGDERPEVGIGLPLAYYTAQRENLLRRLNGISVQVEINEKKVEIFDLKVQVFPQGAGVLFGESLPTDGYAGVVDIGTFTTEYLLFQVVEGQPVPVPEACGSMEAGTQMVYNALSLEFQARTGSPVPSGMEKEIAERALKGLPIFYNGNSYDLSKEALSIRDNVALFISQKVLAAWGNKGGYITRTIMAGGGSLFFEDKVADALPGAVLTGDPIFANANGYLTFLQD